MARSELEELYRILMDARFEFIPDGEMHLRAVYAIVKERYPDLCDDGYLCSTNCKSADNNPEWKHTVRTVLNDMKKRGESVTTGAARGVWVFGRPTHTTADSTEIGVSEGRARLRLHKVKERKSRIVRRKKREVLLATGHLACEVCGFDFASVYGKLGEGFAECHHRVPLSLLDGKSKTRLSDLTIICANCHRMLHRGRPMMTVEDLRSLVQRGVVRR